MKDCADQKIRGIYRMLEQSGNGERNHTIERQVYDLTKEEKKTMKAEEYEELCDRYFAIAFLADQEGFVKGFKYGAALMKEVFS